MNARARIGRALRRWADRIDHHNAPRALGRSFTFERGRGMVFHDNPRAGCPLYYLGNGDYDKAHQPDDHEPTHRITVGPSLDLNQEAFNAAVGAMTVRRGGPRWDRGR